MFFAAFRMNVPPQYTETYILQLWLWWRVSRQSGHSQLSSMPSPLTKLLFPRYLLWNRYWFSRNLLYFLNPFLLYVYGVEVGFFFHLDHFTDGRTPWTIYELVARPLPKHRITLTPNTHALYGIRSHDPDFRASEDSICLRRLGYRDRHSRN
jgi:hypothetical protein